MTGSIKAMQAAAEYYDGLNLGYDQSNRWDLTKNGETDCSAVCGKIADRAGYPINLKGTFYTGNAASRFKAAGFTVLKFTSLSQVKAGDFLLTPGHHIEFAYTATKFFSARQDERGKASGGKTGDQTGKEVGFKAAFNRSGGWTYILRPPAEKKTTSTIPAFPLREGQYFSAQDGPAESISGYKSTRSNGKKGHDGLAKAQEQGKKLGYYSGAVDGLYGPLSKQMVSDVQKAANKLAAKLVVDGELGAKTWPWFWKVPVKVVAPNPAVTNVPKVKIKFTRDENIAKYGTGVVELPIETYLAGVVASEIGESSPREALRAQAVAARTYAMRYVKAGSTIDDTTKYQAFRVSLATKSPRSVAAIKDTAGQVLTYGGSLIQAVYSSSNQGRSTSAKARWGNDFAYLIAQDDPWDVAWRKAHGKATKAHGVGMSQVGAMWAGANDIAYSKILAFYYPGTKLTPNYNL